MKVTLYRYVGDSDTANKILKNCTVVYDKEVIPYGAFNPNGASFRLDTLHDVNYAKFTYNSHDYYGYVDVNTDSKGIYNYSITTDPLTTAWYAGCFNTGNLCKYSDYGTGKFFDGRATYSPDLNYEYIQVKAPSTDFRIILVIARSYGFEKSYGKIYNPLYDVYSMSYGDWNTFADATTGTIYEDYRDSIFRVYAIPSDEISQSSSSIVYEKVSQVGLYGTAKKKVDKLFCPPSSLPQLDDTYRISTPSSNLTYSEQWLPKFTKIIDKPINSWRRQNMIKLYVEDMGYISFKYSDVAHGTNITSIGYRKSYDFISGLQRATLVINDVVLKDYFIQGNIANSVPYFDAEHRQSFNERLTGMLSAGIGLASGIMSFAGTGAASALVDYMSFKGNASATRDFIKPYLKRGIKGAVSIQQLLNQFEKDALEDLWEGVKKGGTGTNAQIAASNIISSINGMNNSSQGSGYTLNGGNSGSLDLPSRQGSFIIWQEAPPHNLADIEGKFGKPDGLVRVVGNLTGWVQTEACHLPSNGLPFDIVTAAEGISNTGFRIVT
nr:MAG TPA: hypothetical protein [Bacteriophage sp.]